MCFAADGRKEESGSPHKFRMLARIYRLPASFFGKVKREKILPIRSLTAGTCYVRCYASELPYGRCTCIVPNSAFPNVVLRNKYRRMFYEQARIQELYAVPGIDFVFLMDKKHADASGAGIADAVRQVKNSFVR